MKKTMCLSVNPSYWADCAQAHRGHVLNFSRPSVDCQSTIALKLSVLSATRIQGNSSPRFGPTLSESRTVPMPPVLGSWAQWRIALEVTLGDKIRLAWARTIGSHYLLPPAELSGYPINDV